MKTLIFVMLALICLFFYLYAFFFSSSNKILQHFYWGPPQEGRRHLLSDSNICRLSTVVNKSRICLQMSANVGVLPGGGTLLFVYMLCMWSYFCMHIFFSCIYKKNCQVVSRKQAHHLQVIELYNPYNVSWVSSQHCQLSKHGKS